MTAQHAARLVSTKVEAKMISIILAQYDENEWGNDVSFDSPETNNQIAGRGT